MMMHEFMIGFLGSMTFSADGNYSNFIFRNIRLLDNVVRCSASFDWSDSVCVCARHIVQFLSRLLSSLRIDDVVIPSLFVLHFIRIFD